MSTNFEPFINYLTVFLDRAGLWFLTGEALAHFVAAGRIDGCNKVEVGMLDTNIAQLNERFETFGIVPEKIGSDCFTFQREGRTVEIQLFSHKRKDIYRCDGKNIELKHSWIVADQDECENIRRKRPEMHGTGLWRRQMDEINALSLNLPYYYGTILDHVWPGWYKKVPRRTFPTTGDVFFNEERKANGRKLISGLYNAGEKAGIADRLFAGFGTCLGYLMYGDFIAKDRDMDMCILSDGTTAEQQKIYADAAYNVDVIKPSRWDYAKREDDKYCWFSVGYKNPVSENGTKSCNWFFYNWNGFLWHSKGGKWINPRKINQSVVNYSMTDEAIGLGLPTWCIEKLDEVDFNGVKILIPDKPGSCCDVWYPNWNPKGDGASAHRNVMVVGKWADQNTWRMA